jgi:hypothetical protein
MTEAEIMVAVRRIDTRRKVGKGFLGFGIVVAAAAAVQLLPGDAGHVGIVETLAFAATAAVCLIVGATLVFSGRIPLEARTERISMMRAEQFQARRRSAFLLMPLSLAFMLMGAVGAAVHVMNGQPVRHVEMFSVAAFVIFLLAFGFLVGGRGVGRWARAVLDDEVSQAFRGKALQFGYMILLPGVAALYVVGLFNRNLSVELAPIVAALGVAGPAVRLFLLERAASDDGGEA